MPLVASVWCEAGPEFGVELQGKVMNIERALYGLKSSAAAWWNMFSQTMCDLVFASCYADLDVKIRPQTKRDGEEYYEYVLIYVDGILCFSHDPHSIMNSFALLYSLNGN